MHVITIETPSLGDRTYVVHDGSDALVVDPQRDIDRVLEKVEDAGVTVGCVVETHLHNDYVSGGLTLARVTGARYVHAAAEDLPFEHEAVGDGDELSVGELEVEVVHTPGHTPHHLSYVVRHGDEPPAAFTGGSLLLRLGRSHRPDRRRRDRGAHPCPVPLGSPARRSSPRRRHRLSDPRLRQLLLVGRQR